MSYIRDACLGWAFLESNLFCETNHLPCQCKLKMGYSFHLVCQLFKDNDIEYPDLCCLKDPVSVLP